MKTTTISIYKSLTLKGLPEGGRQKEFGLILLKCQISAKSPFLIISKYNFHLRHVDMKAKKFVPLKTFPISNIKKLPCYIQTPYCIKKALLHTSYWLANQIVAVHYTDYNRIIQLCSTKAHIACSWSHHLKSIRKRRFICETTVWSPFTSQWGWYEQKSGWIQSEIQVCPDCSASCWETSPRRASFPSSAMEFH